MTRPPRRKDPPNSQPRRRQRGEPRQAPERDADPTERFVRADERLSLTPGEAGAMVVSVPPDADPSDFAMTQPLPRANAEDFDEDLIRTREMPATGDDWLEEMLDSGEQGGVREKMPSRPGRETTGLFPHPASGKRTSAARRSPSQADLPPASSKTPHDDTEARIADAYRQYYALCKEHAQAVVGEAGFAERLRERLARLAEKYPRNKIEFRPVVDDGVVRVRVLLARKRK